LRWNRAAGGDVPPYAEHRDAARTPSRVLGGTGFWFIEGGFNTSPQCGVYMFAPG
jgi:hypothetical protein